MAMKVQGGRMVPTSGVDVQQIVKRLWKVQGNRSAVERELIAVMNNAVNDRKAYAAIKKAASLVSEAGTVLANYMMAP